jgi:hypothetical protein
VRQAHLLDVGLEVLDTNTVIARRGWRSTKPAVIVSTARIASTSSAKRGIGWKPGSTAGRQMPECAS